jgi:hypothetical protein
VLKIVLGQHPVSRRGRIPGELLVLFIDVLGRPAYFHAFGPVGVESPVGVLLGLTATAAPIAPAISVAATLPLHTFEISHDFDLSWIAGRSHGATRPWDVTANRCLRRFHLHPWA